MCLIIKKEEGKRIKGINRIDLREIVDRDIEIYFEKAIKVIVS